MKCIICKKEFTPIYKSLKTQNGKLKLIKSCPECIEYRKKRIVNLRKYRKENNLCIYCGAVLTPYTRYNHKYNSICVSCGEKRLLLVRSYQLSHKKGIASYLSQRRVKRISNGRCAICGIKLSKNSSGTLCELCKFENLKKRRYLTMTENIFDSLKPGKVFPRTKQQIQKMKKLYPYITDSEIITSITKKDDDNVVIRTESHYFRIRRDLLKNGKMIVLYEGHAK